MTSFLLKASLILASASHVLGSCSYGTFLHPRAEEGAPVPISTFGYTGAKGPVNWVALNPETNQACATGTKQSPIDMVDGVFQMVSAADVRLEIPDFAEGTEFENLGTTVEIIAKGGSLQVANMTYEFKQAHFHLPSEHLDNGTSIASKATLPPQLDMKDRQLTHSTVEMHMVFQTAQQEIAVIGVFIDLDNGGAPAAAAAAPTEAPAPAAEKLRFRIRGEKRQEEAAPSPAATSAAGSFGGQQGFLTIPMVEAPGVSSTVLETVFSKVEEIATPGTSTETGPLAMSEIAQTVLTGSFQRLVLHLAHLKKCLDHLKRMLTRGDEI